MSAWIRLMVTMKGLAENKPHPFSRGLVAVALAAPLLMSGCSPTEADYVVAKGQKEVPLTLDDDSYKLNFFDMKQTIHLGLVAPLGTKFLTNGAGKYSLPLEVGQSHNVYFDLVSDGTLVDGKPAKPRRIDFRVEGYERPSPQRLPWEREIRTGKHRQNLVAVQYYYKLATAQQGMEINVGNFRHDNNSQLFVEGNAKTPVLVLKAAPGEEFVFSEKAATFKVGDAVPSDSTKAREYRIQMDPTQVQAFTLWAADQSQRVQPQVFTVQYTPTL